MSCKSDRAAVEKTIYFDIHNTQAGTLDRIDPKNLALCVATMAVVAYTIADMPQPMSGPTTTRQIMN